MDNQKIFTIPNFENYDITVAHSYHYGIANF